MLTTRRAIAWRWTTPILLAIVALVLPLLAVADGFDTPFDEHTHFDYLVKIAAGGYLPPLHDDLGQESLQEAACPPTPAFSGLTCGAPVQDPKRAAFDGESYVTEYFPTYYVLTAGPARAIHALTGASWLTAARAATTAWAGVLAFVIAGILVLLGMSRPIVVGTTLLIVASPLAILQTSHVGNDAAALALVLLPVLVWLALRRSRPSTRLCWSMLAALLALTTKQTAAAGLVAVVALELLAAPPQSARESTDQGRHKTLFVLGAAGLTLAAYGVLTKVIDPLFRGIDPESQGLWNFLKANEPSFPDYFMGALRSAVDAFASAAGPIASPSSGVIAVLLAAWVIGVGINRLLTHPLQLPWAEDDVISGTGMLMLVAFPVILALGVWIESKALAFAPRYIAPSMLLPAAMVATRVTGSRRWLVLAAGIGLLAWGAIRLLG